MHACILQYIHTHNTRNEIHLSNFPLRFCFIKALRKKEIKDKGIFKDTYQITQVQTLAL